MVSLSFKTPAAIVDPSFLPKQWTWSNYFGSTGILNTSQFVRPLLNSIGIGIIATLIAVVLASMAAYAVARLRFPGKGVLIGMALLIAMFPAISILIFICVAIIAFVFIKGFGTAAPGTDIGKR